MTRHRIAPLLLVLSTVAGCQDARVSGPAAPAPGPAAPAPGPAVDRQDGGGSTSLDAIAGIDPSLISGPRDAGGELGAPRVACPGNDARVPQSCASFGVTVDPHYAPSYSCFDLGPVPGVPPQKYGGLVLTTDRCSVTLLIGGEANLMTGKLYKVGVTRDAAGHINGFSGNAAPLIDAPYNDGGVAHGPGDVLFITRYPSNELQLTRPASTTADKVIDLAALGVAQSSASLNFVPDGWPGAGALKLVSWPGGQWYTLAHRPDAQGTFDITAATAGMTLPGGPEGFVYVAAGSPLFPKNSLLISEWSANEISTYEADDAGDPRPGTRRLLIDGLRGAEGAFRDPASGDFFFSTWGQTADRVVVVRGFAPIVIVD
jgi:hypothetical protein